MVLQTVLGIQIVAGGWGGARVVPAAAVLA